MVMIVFVFQLYTPGPSDNDMKASDRLNLPIYIESTMRLRCLPYIDWTATSIELFISSRI